MTWWAEWRSVYFELMTLSTAAPWDPPKGHKHRVYSDGDHSFYEKDIAGNFNQVEEALWAFRNGLSDIVYTIEISEPRYSPQKVRRLKGQSAQRKRKP